MYIYTYIYIIIYFQLADFPWGAERINGFINSPRYNPNPSQREMGDQGLEGLDDFEGDFHVEDGLHIFSPTMAAFSDFGRFLRDVEEIAGRKTGVVKVVVPAGW